MLYDHSQPDANLSEYSINQAAKSVSCVMARMIREPAWSPDDRVKIACVLRRVGLPFLCIDLCIAMGITSKWDIQALGTEEWNLKEKNLWRLRSQQAPHREAHARQHAQLNIVGWGYFHVRSRAGTHRDWFAL